MFSSSPQSLFEWSFPYSGYLGLTPLKLEGVVCTRLGNDRKSLPAKFISVSVRCYESRLGRVGVINSNLLVDYTQLLWSKPDGQDYAEIGNTDFPFRITLPANVQGLSTVTFPDYRVFWRVEAVINHIPITGVGSRQAKIYELTLVRYNLPPHLPLPSSSSSPLAPSQLDSQTTKHRAPVIRYRIGVPPHPIGPLDLVSIPIHLLPVDPAVSIRSASLIVERRSQLIDVSAPPSPPQTHSSITPPPSPPRMQTLTIDSSSQQSSRAPSPSIFSAASTITLNDCCPLLPHRATNPYTPTENHSKTITTTVAGAESSGRFVRDTNGLWTKTLTFQWPAPKSNSRWATGETLQSEMVSIKFFVRVKIVVSSPSGTESIDLAEQELTIVATNAAERELAISNYNKQVQAKKAARASKSPRKMKPRKREVDIPLSLDTTTPMGVDAFSAPTASFKHNNSSSKNSNSNSGKPHPPRQNTASGAPSSSTKSKGKVSSCRPHTSAGPRDKTQAFGAEYRRIEPEDGDEDEDEGPSANVVVVSGQKAGESTPTESVGGWRPPTVLFGQKWLVGSRRMSGVSSSGSGIAHDGVEVNGVNGNGVGKADQERELGLGSLSLGSGQDGNQDKDLDLVQAWEQELARIELQSLRSSADMVGFVACKRKAAERMTDGSPPPVLATSTSEG